MRQLLLTVPVGIGIVAIIRRVLPGDQQAQSKERLLQVPGAMMKHCMEMIPEDSPPKVMMSSVRRFEEQNDEMATLLREQNSLLRKQNDLLNTAATMEPRG